MFRIPASTPHLFSHRSAIDEAARLDRLAPSERIARLGRKDALSPEAPSRAQAAIESAGAHVQGDLEAMERRLDRDLGAELSRPTEELRSPARIAEQLESRTVPTILKGMAAELSRAEAEVRATAMRLNAFRRDRGVEHRAVRDAWTSLLIAVVAILAILAESAMNGAFFRDATAGGMLQGWLVAIGFALFNVVLSGLLGAIFLRHALNGASLGVRVGATVGLLVGAGLLSLGHLLLVSLRSEAVRTGFLDEAALLAVDRLIEAPLHWVGDLSSIALVTLGVAISLLGVIKGARAAGDPIPGLLPLHTANLKAALDREALIENAYDDVKQAAQDAEQACLSVTCDAQESDRRLCALQRRTEEMATAFERLPARLEALRMQAETARKDERRVLELAAPYDAPAPAGASAAPASPTVASCQSARTRVERHLKMIEDARKRIADGLRGADLPSALVKIEDARDGAMDRIGDLVDKPGAARRQAPAEASPVRSIRQVALGA